MKIKRNTIIYIFIVPVLFIIWYVSSLSTLGPDYINYIWMIDRVQTGGTFIEKIFLSKDLLFGIITAVINPDSREQYYLIFMAILSIVLISRIILIKKVGWGIIPYIILYVFLLSPGLDYSAIRALLGLSFILMYFSLNKKPKYLLLLALLSHLSMILPILFSFNYTRNIIDKIGVFWVSSVFFLVSMLSSRFLYLLPQTESYIDNTGSWLLFFRVLILLIITILFYFVFFYNKFQSFSSELIKISIYLNSIALGAINVSVAANRIMEMAAYFTLAAIFAIKIKELNNSNKIIVYILLIVVLVMSFVYRNTRSELWYLLFSFK